MNQISKKLTRILFALLLSGTHVCAQSGSLNDAAIEQRIDSLLRVMTLEEKLGQLNQITPNWNPDAGTTIPDEQKELLRKGKLGSYLNLIGAARTQEVQRIAVEESRLHIPLIFGLDVIHGFKTIFPVPLAEACTWDTMLIRKAAHVAAIEASASGLHWTFAPMVDICRDPRWGRITEGSGEDPHLGSAMAVARVQGFQGGDLRNPGNIMACAKHFVAYGGAEGGRDYNTVDMSERTLRTMYLPPFKAAVEAGVGSLMSSFNEISGVPSSANRWLMTDVLRKEWKFNGFVVSDWTAVEELQPHGVAASREQAGILALNAGVDMDMMAGIYANELAGAVRARKISDEVVNESVRRVLRAKFQLGLFENPYRNCDTTWEKMSQLKPEHIALARKVAGESIVLLKNDNNLLPLKKDLKTIAVLGPLAADTYNPLGAWHAQGNKENVVSVLDAIKKTVSRRTRVLYEKACEIEADSGFNLNQAIRLAKNADATVLVLGESLDMSGEAASRSNLDLPGRQKELVQAIYKTGKPFVLVLMNGRPLTISWEAEHSAAILEAWFPGIQAGNAIADVLFGDVNPSGKLSVSFPRSVGQIPLSYNNKNTGRPFDSKNKFTSKYLDIPNTPLYPFGFGLSYTTFSYSNLRVSAPSITSNQNLTVEVAVTNSGNVKGDEVVQLYIQDVVASVTRPLKELKGFRRLSLGPGEKETIHFVVKPEHLSFYNQEMKNVIEPGTFKVFVGTNSVDILETRFEVIAN